jgi:hypothetical protein
MKKPTFSILGAFVSAVLILTSATSGRADPAHVNPYKDKEHEALLDLLPPASATHLATVSGPWSSPATWQSGQIPVAAARVHIPPGVTVTYDVDSSTPLFWLRIDGTLTFSTTTNTRLVIDTIGVMPGGAWIQGTTAAPIPTAFSSRIYFTDTGSIDRIWDPTLLSRGYISHGATTIHGAVKTSHVKVPAVSAGATTLPLASAPSGWQVGDTVILTGAKLTVNAFRQNAYQDEVRVITAINGANITLNAPLVHDHVPPASPVPLYNYLGNYTRNISFESVNKSLDPVSSPASAAYAANADIQRRAHFMCMHSTAVAIAYAAFDDLGRSNKNLLVDDVEDRVVINSEFFTGPDGVFYEGGSVYPMNGDNPRARYALHLHLCGSAEDPSSSDGSGTQYTYTKPIIVQGCSVMNTPGWGFVNHDSHVNFLDNVSYNAWGAGFVEESGNGIGVFQNCLAVRNGKNSRYTYQREWRETLGVIDLGHAGHGFFYRGNLVDTIDCVAVSCDSGAYAWDGKHGAGASRIATQNLPYPAIANGQETIQWDTTPVSVFRDSVAIASNVGAFMWYSQPTGDGRTHVERLHIWNVIDAGITSNYGNFSGNITITDCVMIADRTAADFATFSKGFAAQVTITDVLYDNNHVEGFFTGVLITHPDDYGVRFVQLMSNNQFVNCDNLIDDVRNRLTHHASPADRDTFSFTVTGTSFNGGFGAGVNILGIKSYPIGTYSLGFPAGNTDNDGYGQFKNPFRFESSALRSILAKGYFTDTGGTYIVLPFAVTNRLTCAVKTYYHKLYLNLASSFLQNETKGPNRGVFSDPGFHTVPSPLLSVPGGAHATPQTVSVVNVLPGAYHFYTTDGSTPAIDAERQPLGTTRRYTEPLAFATGSTTLQIVAHAGIMTPSPVLTVTYDLPEPPSSPPAVPTALVATALSDRRIDLTWTDQSADETAFEIQRSPGGASAWSDLATLQFNLTAHSDTTGLLALTDYDYRIRATNTAGASAWSPVASATTGAAQPTITASGENPPNEDRTRAFDGNPSTKWLTFSSSAWLQYAYAAPTRVVVTSYALTSGNDDPGRDPSAWQLLGSLDGSAWTVLDARNGQTFTARGQRRLFNFANSTAYSRYRLAITANSGSSLIQLAELELIPATLTAYQTWLVTHSLPTDAADSADADSDGSPNLLEYALGTGPDSSASRPILESQISNLKLQLSFPRLRADVVYLVEASPDLVTWSEVAYVPVSVGELQTVIDPVALPDADPPRRFLRLRVTRP